MSSPHEPARPLKVCAEAFPGFSHMHHPGGLNSTLLLPGCDLANGTSAGNMGRTNTPRMGEGVRGLPLPETCSWVHRQSHPAYETLPPQENTHSLRASGPTRFGPIFYDHVVNGLYYGRRLSSQIRKCMAAPSHGIETLPMIEVLDRVTPSQTQIANTLSRLSSNGLAPHDGSLHNGSAATTITEFKTASAMPEIPLTH